VPALAGFALSRVYLSARREHYSHWVVHLLPTVCVLFHFQLQNHLADFHEILSFLNTYMVLDSTAALYFSVYFAYFEK
jgi:hypothetical protein